MIAVELVAVVVVATEVAGDTMIGNDLMAVVA